MHSFAPIGLVAPTVEQAGCPDGKLAGRRLRHFALARGCASARLDPPVTPTEIPHWLAAPAAMVKMNELVVRAHIQFGPVA